MAKHPRQRMMAKAVQEEAERPVVLPAVPVKAEEDAERWGRDGLTLRQRRFVKAYVGSAGGNATRAAQMAGYGESNERVAAATASRLLRNVNVQRRLGREFAKGVGGKEWTRRSLVELANANVDAYLAEDGSLDIERARAAGAMGAIKKLKIRDMGEAGRQIEIETYDRLAALSALAKIHGTLVDRVEHTGANGGPIETKHSVDYDAIEAELRSIAGGRMAGRASENN